MRIESVRKNSKKYRGYEINEFDRDTEKYI